MKDSTAANGGTSVEADQLLKAIGITRYSRWGCVYFATTANTRRINGLAQGMDSGGEQDRGI